MEHPQRAVFVVPIRPRKLILPAVLLAGLATLMLVQKPVEASYAPIPTDPPAELQLVPRGTFFFLHVNMAGLLNKDLAKAVIALMPQDGRGDPGVREFGAPLSDLEAIAMMGGERSMFLVVTVKKAVDTKKIVATLAPKASENTYKGKVIHVGTGPGLFEDIKPFDDNQPRERPKDGPFPRDGAKDRPLLPPPPPLPPQGREFKDGPIKEGDSPRDAVKDRGPGPGQERINQWAPAVYFLSERTFIKGPARDVMYFIDNAEKPDEKHPLIDALSLAGKHHYTQGVALPEELANQMKREFTGEFRHEPLAHMAYQSLRPLLDFRKLTLTADLGDESRIDAVATFPTNKSAEKAQDATRFALQLFKGSAGIVEEGLASALGGEEKIRGTKIETLLDAYRAAFNDAVVKADGSTVKATMKLKTDADTIKAVFAEMAPKVQQSANRARSQNNLKQLAIAFHNYHDVMGHSPPASALYDKQGKANGLSWRVHLLPYLEQEQLYRQFKFDEPWDSENNKKLIAKMPKLFELPGAKAKEGMTYYQGIAATGNDANATVFPHQPNAKVRITAITDGSSNTIGFVEAAEPVIWTKPDDVFYNPKQKMLPLMGGFFNDGFNVGFLDGSVRFIQKKIITEDILKALMTVNGGEAVDFSFEDDRVPRRGFKDVPRTAPPRIEDPKPIERPFDPPPPPRERKDR